MNWCDWLNANIQNFSLHSKHFKPLYYGQSLIGFMPSPNTLMPDHHLVKILDRGQFLKFHPDRDCFLIENGKWAEFRLETEEKWPIWCPPIQKRWRGELYAVYGEQYKVLGLIERSLCRLLGFRIYGVHVNGFTKSPETGRISKMWIARRSLTKQTYPGLLDNVVGGGLAYPHTPYDCLKAECIQEASIPTEILPQVPSSVVTLQHVESDLTGIQLESVWIYDLDMTPTSGSTVIKPQINDGEVHEFIEMGLDEVKERLLKNEFMPTSALVCVDFLLRHGMISPEKDHECLDLWLLMRNNFPTDMHSATFHGLPREHIDSRE